MRTMKDNKDLDGLLNHEQMLDTNGFDGTAEEFNELVDTNMTFEDWYECRDETAWEIANGYTSDVPEYARHFVREICRHKIEQRAATLAAAAKKLQYTSKQLHKDLERTLGLR